jgi:excisionase family DNA binding protein
MARRTDQHTLAPGGAAGERLVDAQEAARMLGLKPATLYQWAYKRRIPVVKLFGPRGALRFRLNDVERLIQDSLRPAARLPANE